MDAARNYTAPAAASSGGRRAGGIAHMVGDPHAETAGNPAWQKTMAMLERVVAEEDARRRRN